MNKKFSGIEPDAVMLLAENCFNNSKAFYEEHKEEIKRGIRQPLYDLISDLSESLAAVDSQILLIPNRMISRVRRDTRYTRDKSLYRENVWIMFMRDKKEWNYRQPCMWFEFSPQGMNYGVGTFGCDPTFMAAFRKKLDEKGEEFLKAAKKIKRFGIEPQFETYKKDRSEGKNPQLRQFYNAREIYFISPLKSLETLFNGEIEDELRKAIKVFTPMYNFLLEVMYDITENNEGSGNNA